jgi:hypothetical protein
MRWLWIVPVQPLGQGSIELTSIEAHDPPLAIDDEGWKASCAVPNGFEHSLHGCHVDDFDLQTLAIAACRVQSPVRNGLILGLQVGR